MVTGWDQEKGPIFDWELHKTREHQRYLARCMDRLGALFMITGAAHLSPGEKARFESDVMDDIAAYSKETDCEPCKEAIQECIMYYRLTMDRIAIHLED